MYGERQNFLTATAGSALGESSQGARNAAIPAGRDGSRTGTHPARVSSCCESASMRARRPRRLRESTKFIVLPRPFTVAADELTVSLKMRRGVIFAKHRAQLDALYHE